MDNCNTYINLFLSLFQVSPFGSVAIIPAGINTSIGSIEMLTCLAMGGPNNSFSWTREPGGAEIAITPAQNVSINNALSGGEYLCTVTNAAGSDNASVMINGML